LQTSHGRLQSLWQHTPSTHLFEMHSLFCVHVWPVALRVKQTPPVQYEPAAHCALSVHPVGQMGAVPSHRYGEHGGAPTLPAVKVSQLPSWPVTLQVWHWPSQAVSQQ
jgi:hypothetical protein